MINDRGILAEPLLECLIRDLLFPSSWLHQLSDFDYIDILDPCLAAISFSHLAEPHPGCSKYSNPNYLTF
jgi:hypothetical protein